MRQIPTSVALALDPGLAHVGYIIARIWRGQGLVWDIEIVEAGIWIAELPEADERVLDVIDDTTNRAMFQVGNVLSKYTHEGASVVVAEKISHPRDASTAIQVTAFWAMLTYALKLNGIPFETLRPQDIRSTLGLPKTTRAMTRNDKKKLVHDELERRYGMIKLKALMGHLKRKEDRSHPLDALASFTAMMIRQFGSSCVLR